MGYLHEGHLALIDMARERADFVMVSLFVNPTQFGPSEDLAAYPRDAARDEALARERGVDVLFAPAAEAMYTPGACTWVEVGRLARGLCAIDRPTHFRGVATVVAKLFMLAWPSLAVFGEKDWQQLAVIRRMARDLNIPTEVLGHPIVREADGLAMSSRNVYLAPAEREQAAHIVRGLEATRRLAQAGTRDAQELTRTLKAYYRENIPLARIDYVEIFDPETIEPVASAEGPTRAAVALKFSRARLLDNMALNP
jgi:pantoate--beta-alanine ligase